MQNRTLLLSWRNRWNVSLLQFLRRRVQLPVDIEDIAQETWLRLFRARDLREVRNPHTYLLRVASNVAREWRESHPMVESLTGEEELLLVDGSTPEFELSASISQRRFDEALMSASPVMRAVLLLRIRDERSCKQIARELGITDRQVKRYLARGYERLRHVVET